MEIRGWFIWFREASPCFQILEMDGISGVQRLDLLACGKAFFLLRRISLAKSDSESGMEIKCFSGLIGGLIAGWGTHPWPLYFLISLGVHRIKKKKPS